MKKENEFYRELVCRELARRRLQYFISYCYSPYILTQFHKTYISIIQHFISGNLNKLIVSIPPQHGKSIVSSQYLPAFMLGQNPHLKIAIMSYNTSLARRFGRRAKQIIANQEYRNIFPDTRLPDATDALYVNSADYVDIPVTEGEPGCLLFGGRGSGWTGNPIDVLIMDDLYKDYKQALSPVIRQSVIDMYDTVAESRLHNKSKQLIVFTRWHEQDLVGYLEKNESITTLNSMDQLDNVNPYGWYRINFEALKTTNKTELDPREIGEPLFAERHNQQKLENTRDRMSQTEPEKWVSVYQGNPQPITGLLYGSGFKTYSELPEYYSLKNMTDSADRGTDRTCSICYADANDGFLYIIDIYYSQEPAEVTEIEICDMLCRNNIKDVCIESNAGGRQYGRNIMRMMQERKQAIELVPFHQTANKESRIISSASNVLRCILFPRGWIVKWPMFAEELLRFRKIFSANDYDDAPDTLTLMIERMESVEDQIYMGVV